MIRKDLTGKQFGRLTVVSLARVEKNKYGSRAFWNCLCECGKEIIARADALTTGNTQSCGCLQRDNAGGVVIHGGSYTRLYSIWHDMKTRCCNPKAINYKDYGAKGVAVCSEWRSDFQSFRDWALSNGYSETLTLDRINPYGNYEPSNCRWATWHEQNTNKRAK